MPTFRERAVNLLLGKEKEQLQDMMRQMQDAYLSGPWQLPPEELMRQLKETDSALINDLVNQMGYDLIGGMVGYIQDTEAERQRSILDSRRLWRYAPLAQWAVQVWTNFGLGESLKIVGDDVDGDEIWQEVWSAKRNSNLFADDRLHELSNWTLVDGNAFIAAFVSSIDGIVTFAEIPCTEITEIITNPDNSNEPLFYKRVWVTGSDTMSKTLYYPDADAFFDEEFETRVGKLKTPPKNIERADKINEATPTCVLHIAHNRKVRGSLWGWPILSMSAPYMRAHKSFMEDRLSVTAAKAMYVRKTQIQGGSRALASVRNKLKSGLSASNSLDTNPPAPAGSHFLENQMSNTTDLPMTTGASDAKNDNEMFAWMALISVGLFPTTAGMDTSRWATALAMDKTQSMQWSRYQTFWSAQFTKLYEITLLFAEKYGNKSFPNKNCQVSIDSFSIVDFPGVAEALSPMLDSAATLVEKSVIPSVAARRLTQQVWRIMLKALGVDDEDVTSDETFGITQMPAEVNKTIQTAVKKFELGELSADKMGQFLLTTLAENYKAKK